MESKAYFNAYVKIDSENYYFSDIKCLKDFESQYFYTPIIK